MMLRTALLAVLLAVAVAADAGACSCVPPEEVYRTAKVAFTGTVVERSAERTTIDVERVFKGSVAGRVTYKGTGGGMAVSSCDPGIEAGERVGVMAEPGTDLNMCQVTTPGELERIAAPLPEPSSPGPPAFLVGGSFGAKGTVALDAAGRIVRYGAGHGWTMAACPGGRRFVAAETRWLVVRRVSDLSLVRRLRGGGPSQLRCLDRDGRRIAGFDARGTVSLWTGRRRRTIRVPRGQSAAALGTRRAVVATGAYEAGEVVAVDYATGRRRVVHRSDRYVYAVGLSPDERRAVVLAHRISAGSRVDVVALTPGGPGVSTDAFGELEGNEAVAWPARGRLLLAVRGRLHDLDPDTLDVRRSVTGWGVSIAVRGGGVYGLADEGRLVSADFETGRARQVAVLPRARVWPLLALPAAPQPRGRAASAYAGTCRWRGLPARPFAA